MSVVSTLVHALPRKRLASLLVAVSLCTSIAACSDNDRSADASVPPSGANQGSADSGHAQPAAQDNSLAASPAVAAVTIQTPASPASGADAALSAAASTPLATPVIHTVD